MSKTIIRTAADGILTLAFNRPEKLNAFDTEMTAALLDGLAEAERDPEVRCVILAGTGRAFSSGQDLEAFVRMQESGRRISVAEHLRTGYNRIAATIRSLEKPVIARMHGFAAGAGLSTALACDMRIASEDATFTLGFSRIGLIPDGGASLFLPLLVGFGRGLELAWTSDRIDAIEAHRIGLVNQVVAGGEIERATLARARALAERPASALALTKRAFNAAMLPQLAEWLDREAELQEEAARYEDHAEGVRSFVEKRAPRFTHR